MRWCLPILVLATSQARAGGVPHKLVGGTTPPPHGAYSLGKQPAYGPWTDGERELPTCGDEGTKAVASFKGLSIYFRGKVWVAGHEWIDDGVHSERGHYVHQIHQPDTSKDVRIIATFWRDHAGAKAWLLFIRLDEASKPVCVDGAVFQGTYAP